MEDISATEIKEPGSVEGVGPKGGTQNKSISIRLPASLVADIEAVAQGNGEARSEVIRSVLEGVFTMAKAGFNEEQALQCKTIFLQFYRWLGAPMETAMYLMYRLNMSVATPYIQKQWAMTLTKNLIALAKAMAEEQKETVVGRFLGGQNVKAYDYFDEANEEFLAAEMLAALQKGAPTGRLADKMREAAGFSDEDTEGGDQGDLAAHKLVRLVFGGFVSDLSGRILAGMDPHAESAVEAQEIADKLEILIWCAGAWDYYSPEARTWVHDELSPMAHAVHVAAELTEDEELDIEVDAFKSAYEDFCLVCPPLYKNLALREAVELLLLQSLCYNRLPSPSEQPEVKGADQERAEEQEGNEKA